MIQRGFSGSGSILLRIRRTCTVTVAGSCQSGDDCQTSCPPNVISERSAPGPLTEGTTSVEVAELLSLDDDALLDRFGAWYIPRREPRYLRRNALVVLGNVGDPASQEVRELVAQYVASPDPIERSHAVWAAERLGFDDLAGDPAGIESLLGDSAVGESPVGERGVG